MFCVSSVLCKRNPMKLHVGTSGYSYKEWKGNFYPEDLPAKEMLAYYSRRLPAVEINNTFYRLPQPGMIENWKEQVPKRFRFSIKASQRITHIKRMNNVADETKYLLETAALLEERLGVVLFQLPPNMKKDTARLKAFLDLLPAEIRARLLSSVTRPGSTTKSLVCCARRTARWLFPTRTKSRSPKSSARRSGVTCVCGAPLTTKTIWWNGCSECGPRNGKTPSSFSSMKTKASAQSWRRSFWSWRNSIATRRHKKHKREKLLARSSLCAF